MPSLYNELLEPVTRLLVAWRCMRTRNSSDSGYSGWRDARYNIVLQRHTDDRNDIKVSDGEMGLW